MGFFFCGNIVILHFRFETRISSNNDILEQHFQTQSRSMVVAMAKALVIRYPDNSEWAKRLFKIMSYNKRERPTTKLEMHAGSNKEAELLFHHQIVEQVKANHIPDSLVFNFDKTSLKYVPVATTILAK